MGRTRVQFTIQKVKCKELKMFNALINPVAGEFIVTDADIFWSYHKKNYKSRLIRGIKSILIWTQNKNAKMSKNKLPYHSKLLEKF